MDKDFAQIILRQTSQTYDSIAEDFSKTRSQEPKETTTLLLSYIAAGSKVLDIGCGNGRFCRTMQKIGADYVGIDNSKKLIEIARKRFANLKFEVGEAADIPFPAETFDYAFSTAVLHHIPSKEMRVKFFYEAHRVLKKNAFFIVTAWDLRPLNMIKERKWKRLRHYIKEQAAIAVRISKFDFGDFYVPWRNNYWRYVHAFNLGELRRLASSVGFMIIDSGILKAGTSKEQNLYIVVKKQ